MEDALDASDILNFFVCNHTKDNAQLLLLNILAMGKILPDSSQKDAENESERKGLKDKGKSSGNKTKIAQEEVMWHPSVLIPILTQTTGTSTIILEETRRGKAINGPKNVLKYCWEV